MQNDEKRIINQDEKNEDIKIINERNHKLNNVKELGNQEIPMPPEDIHFISIIGEIEGHIVAQPQKKATKYEHIIPQLLAAERDPKIKGLLILINTVGGDVEAGLALSEMINSMSKPKVSLILGGGHSIGVPLATSSDYSYIVPTATMTLHPIRMTGLVIGVPQTFRYFQKMQQRILDFILRTSDISREYLKQLMYETDEIANDVGTILIGQEAVECGLIDEVGGLDKAIAKLYELMES
ncbi:ClpP family protease [Abyssisolibacter fermentans]|uniref:ClpP family protease n=1 Tax=Abyssisolibacter fermentans TaxID=1766203 RepID=UPI00082AC40C|nr:ATP-dependent Clp protease proteolytic subunit [Abyssisolibacter fermentans]